MEGLELKMVLNLRKLRLAGIIPGYMNSCGMGDRKKSPVDYGKVPFSKYYNTYKEYEQAYDKLLYDMSEGNDLDEEEIFKVAKTREELGIEWQNGFLKIETKNGQEKYKIA